MARISGVDIPKQKRGVIALTYIYGIGKSRAQNILALAKVSEDTKVSDWTDEETGRIREAVSGFKIEGELRSELQPNIKRLMDIGSYRGIRHRSGLPFEDKEQRTILELEKEKEKLSRIKRKSLNNTEPWQKLPVKKEKLLLNQTVKHISLHLLIILLFL